MPAKTVSPVHAPTGGALDPKAASAYLGGLLSPGSLANRRSNGDDAPRHVKIGRNVAYRIVDLETWLAGHVVGGAR